MAAYFAYNLLYSQHTDQYTCPKFWCTLITERLNRKYDVVALIVNLLLLLAV